MLKSIFLIFSTNQDSYSRTCAAQPSVLCTTDLHVPAGWDVGRKFGLRLRSFWQGLRFCILSVSVSKVDAQSVIIVSGKHVNKPRSTSAITDVQACNQSPCTATAAGHCRLRSTRARSAAPQHCQGSLYITVYTSFCGIHFTLFVAASLDFKINCAADGTSFLHHSVNLTPALISLFLLPLLPLPWLHLLPHHI